MQKYKMIIAYDGTDYSGWQVQPNSITIQEVLEKALSTILQTPTKVIGSGRTDAGVHAKGQVAHFRAQNTTSIKLLRSLNGLLPQAIRITSLKEVDDSFHARFSARGKSYHYHIQLGEHHDPFLRPYSYHVRRPFDIACATEAACYFVGTHNFSAFANQANKGSAKNAPVKTLYRLDIIQEGDHIRFEFEGSGFLYKMVRNIVGALLAVASKKLPPNAIPEILASRDRKKAPRAAPAHGLFLMHVTY